jgi:hypothetical protein
MRDSYFNLLKSYQLQDTLSEIQGLSFSKKESILRDLLLKYPKEIINMSLADYKREYINIGRVNFIFIENQIKGICQRIHESMENKK